MSNTKNLIFLNIFYYSHYDIVALQVLYESSRLLNQLNENHLAQFRQSKIYPRGKKIGWTTHKPLCFTHYVELHIPQNNGFQMFFLYKISENFERYSFLATGQTLHMLSRQFNVSPMGRFVIKKVTKNCKQSGFMFIEASNQRHLLSQHQKARFHMTAYCIWIEPPPWTKAARGIICSPNFK